MSGDWREELQSRIAGSVLHWNAPLDPLVTLRLGGAAECLVELESEADLGVVFDVVGKFGLPYHVLGKGSNVLIPDAGVKGVVIRLGKAFRALEPCGQSGEGEGWVRAGAAMANAAFVEACRPLGLGGMEFLVAIPGSIGGAIAMNAGAHDGETAAFLRSVRAFKLGKGIVEKPADDFVFGYRASPLRAKSGWIVLSAVFALQLLDEEEMKARQHRIQQWRRAHHPRDFPNCGSVFKNPPGDFAARLIDEAGLKGRTIGGAQVSEKHANFIVNRGNAAAADVSELIALIQETVYKRYKVSLELELEVFPGAP